MKQSFNQTSTHDSVVTATHTLITPGSPTLTSFSHFDMTWLTYLIWTSARYSEQQREQTVMISAYKLIFTETRNHTVWLLKTVLFSVFVESQAEFSCRHYDIRLTVTTNNEIIELKHTAVRWWNWHPEAVVLQINTELSNIQFSITDESQILPWRHDQLDGLVSWCC